VQKDQNTNPGFSIAHIASFWIGRAFDSGDRYFDGLVDELRVESVPRSSNWVWACWLNTASNGVFNSVGPLAGGGPTVLNADATNVTFTSASLNGYLSSTGQSPTQVTVYWGTSDGGAAPGNWRHTNAFAGAQAPGPLSMGVTFAPGALYYYRYYAVNAGGEDWAGPAASVFPGEVTLEVTDASAREFVAELLELTLHSFGSRPPSHLAHVHPLREADENRLLASLPVTVVEEMGEPVLHADGRRQQNKVSPGRKHGRLANRLAAERRRSRAYVHNHLLCGIRERAGDRSVMSVPDLSKRCCHILVRTTGAQHGVEVAGRIPPFGVDCHAGTATKHGPDGTVEKAVSCHSERRPSRSPERSEGEESS